MATMQPARVASMIVISAPAAFPEQAKRIQRNFSEAMLDEPERVRLRARHQRPGQFEALLAQVREMPNGNDPAFSQADLGTIAADTLIVFGDRDPLYPVSVAAQLREAIPRSWLWVVPNGGHGPVFGRSAPMFVRVAFTFLAGKYEDLGIW
jgi:pimeloyl-ACP methyl ester carboxylesterase